MQNQKRNVLLELAIVLIITGTIFDSINAIATMPFNEAWIETHLLLKDLMFVGFAIGFFIQTSYKTIQLKAFTFMLVFWRVIVALFNGIGFYQPYVIIVLYAIYIFWLFKIFSIKEIPLKYTGTEPQTSAYSYNILIPVHTFRGLLKSLFCPFSDPRYETTILVNNGNMYYIKNNFFFKTKRKDETINKLIKKNHAKVIVKPISPKQLRKINKLSHKRSFLGLRDCRILRIK